jgi:lambda family phage portal protein
MSSQISVSNAEVGPVQEDAIGGALEGVDQLNRETLNWNPAILSPDQIINPAKIQADARGRDMVQNDGYANGAVALYRDNIVGSQYRLNSKPNFRALGVSEEWAEEFQEIVEARFNVAAESQDCWFDASRRNTLTEIIRLVVGGYVMTGEVLASAEWIREARRPFATAIQIINPDRLSNPDGAMDDRFLRRGVRIDARGRPLGYWVRKAYPTEMYMGLEFSWTYVPAEKPWGRKQMLHIVEQLLPDQNRGVSDMVAVLKQMKMTKKFQEITLQNAVVNATYAAAIESELPGDVIFQQMGGETGKPFAAMSDYLKSWMGALGSYLDNSKNIAVDGVKMPHLFPGTKLKMQPLGTPGGVGTGFEESLLRHIAACLGLSYEQFSRDYTKTNYSSARASMNETWKFMQGRKKVVADRTASFIFALWLEEEINAGNLPLPDGKDASWFYEPMVKDCLTQCNWIGASRGQIDEKKETEAAVLRMDNNLSTLENECAKMGEDYRDVLRQRAREQKMKEKLGLMTLPKADPAPGQPTSNDDVEEEEEARP